MKKRWIVHHRIDFNSMSRKPPYEYITFHRWKWLAKLMVWCSRGAIPRSGPGHGMIGYESAEILEESA